MPASVAAVFLTVIMFRSVISKCEIRECVTGLSLQEWVNA